MKRNLVSRLLMVAVLLLPTPLLAQLRFQEGRHYVTVPTPQVSGTVPADRIEVAEVFSYLCGGCYQAQQMVKDLAAKLPADAAMAYVHAGFNTTWPLFQQAHLTAQSLGIADRDHARMFTGIWETGEVPYIDMARQQLRQPGPTMRDLAKFYAKGGGTTEADFQKKAASPRIAEAVKRSDALIRGWQVGSTPTFVVAGRYRVESKSLSSEQELQSLVLYLIGLERTRLRGTSAAPAAGAPAAAKPAASK